MTTYEYTLPDVGEGTAEGELLQWYVAEGDEVEEDQVIAEVETDKAVVDIPSPVDGVVSELLFAAGDVIPVGDVFVVFEVDGESTTDETAVVADESTAAAPASGGSGTESAPPPSQARAFAPPSVRRLARELGVSLDAVTGSGPGGRVSETDVRAAAEGSPPGSADELGDSAMEVESVTGPRESEATVSRERTLAQPTTRRVAHELDVDINQVPEVEAWDDESFVTAEAVREFAEGGGEPESPPAPRSEPTDTSVKVEERIPYRGVRRTIGEQMEQSKFTIPHVSTVDEADVTELVELRERLAPAADQWGVSLTYLAFAVKAVGTALQEFPYLNATLDTDAEEIVLKGDYNVGIATESEDGLRVPVVDDVDEKGLLQVAEDVARVTRKAQEGTISREEMQGGTFTISNIGPYGGEHGTPIINYPEVGIIAMGRVKEKPRVVDDEIVKRHVVHLSLSFDHRVVDGAMATQFLNRVIEQLETPELFLLE